MDEAQDSAIEVHLDVDHAESPVWFHGPIPYEELHLSPELEGALRTWEEERYRVHFRGEGDDLEGARRVVDEEGRRLANRLASELGQGVVVHFGEVVHRSDEPATNPKARRAIEDAAHAWREFEAVQCGHFEWRIGPVP